MLAGEAILLLFLPAISGFAPGFLFSDESAYDYGAQAAGGFEYREIACRIYASTVRRSRWDVPYNGHAFTMERGHPATRRCGLTLWPFVFPVRQCDCNCGQ